MNTGVKTIAAFDLGTKTGWAVNIGGRLVSGQEDFTPNRFASAGMRYIRFRHWLEDFLMHLDRPLIVAYEEVRRHMGADAAHVYGGLLAMLQGYCDESKIPYVGIPVGAIKKHATGKGNANKDEMVQAAKAAFPEQDITSDDQADALWIRSLAEKNL